MDKLGGTGNCRLFQAANRLTRGQIEGASSSADRNVWQASRDATLVGPAEGPAWIKALREKIGNDGIKSDRESARGVGRL
jgi:hypothetical protein